MQDSLSRRLGVAAMSLSSVRSFDRLIRHALCGPLLALLLVLAQVGAVRHEISHLLDDQRQLQTHAKQLAHAGNCEVCLGYAQLASTLASTPVAALVMALVHAVPCGSLAQGIGQDAPTARGRGPPLEI